MTKVFNEKNDNKVFISLAILLVMYCFPIIFTGRLYIDDLGRTLYGYTGWGLNGRPLSDMLMSALNYGTPLLDISPLNQILSVILLAGTLYFYAKTNFPTLSYISTTAIIFFFIANPFYIENLSYKYDSLTMSLSIITLIIPFIIRFNNAYDVILSITMIICSLSLYQASLGLFAILTVIELTTKFSKLGNKHILLRTLSRLLQITIGYVIYRIFIASKFVEGEYNLTHSKTLPLNIDSLVPFEKNLSNVLWYFNEWIASIPLFATITYALIFLISIIFIARDLYDDGLRKNALSFAILLSSPLLIFIFSFAPLLTLEFPVFAPRVLICFGGVLLYFSLIILRVIKNNHLKTLVCLPMLWVALYYSYSFSNASSSQRDIDSLISSSIYNDASHYGNEFKYVNIIGKMPESKQFSLAQSKLPIMSRLIPVYMNGDWLWGAELLNHYGMTLQYKVIDEDTKKNLCQIKPFVVSKYYNLYSISDVLIISFTKSSC